ncbi:MAG: hypothetical protein H8F28_12065 [Fibrella sp.]|nr:hypothetical protein [Armatimonadota bacterium]
MSKRGAKDVRRSCSIDRPRRQDKTLTRKFFEPTVAVVFAVALMSIPATVHAQGSPWIYSIESGIEPFIELEKTRFAVGEDVVFRVGVRPADKNKAVPKTLRNKAMLTITRPDGTRKFVFYSRPIDGETSGGWNYRSGINEAAVPGEYEIVFGFAGQNSAPETFTVEPVDFIKKVHACFVFGASHSTDTPVTLTIRNDSDQILRLPHAFFVDSTVRISGEGKDNPYRFFSVYPVEELLPLDYEKASRNNPGDSPAIPTQKVATRTLQPGEVHKQDFSLNIAVAEARRRVTVPAGTYAVKFETQIRFIVGEPGGKFATLSPMQLSVETTSVCTIVAH